MKIKAAELVDYIFPTLLRKKIILRSNGQSKNETFVFFFELKEGMIE